MDASAASTTSHKGAASSSRNSIEELSREELLNKYKGLLGIAKKAKQAKDELTEENRILKEALSRNETQKEADKKALLTMKEMLEQFTENKLQLTTQLSEMQNKSRNDDEALTQLSIENESLKRQVHRLTEDNDGLLLDIDRMDDQLKQVNLLGLEQKKHLELLELEVNKLKDDETMALEENKTVKESENAVKKELSELLEKHKRVKEINSEQRHKFNALKDRFVDLHRKLKKVKECKRVLLETQHEYSEAVSKWQKEIIEASKLLCSQMNALKRENEELLQKLNAQSFVQNSLGTNVPNIENISMKINEIQQLSTSVFEEQRMKYLELEELRDENHCLKSQLMQNTASEHEQSSSMFSEDQIEDFRQQLLTCQQAYTELLSQKPNEPTTALYDIVQKSPIDVEYMTKKVKELEQLCTNALQEYFEKSQALKELKVESKYKETVTEMPKNIAVDIEYIITRVIEMEQMCTNALQEHAEKSSTLQELKAENNMLSERLEELSKTTENLLNPEKDKEILNLREQLQCCQQEYEELVALHKEKQREHTDLLDEMRELNEALKARGDVISRQQEKQQELVAELRATTITLNQIEENLCDKEKTLAEKIDQVMSIRNEVDVARNKITELETICAQSDEQIRSLTDELQNMRQANVDVQSDVMSTSTISRADELNRMRDIEETFEDKYNKLRTLAVKLKKKMQEQTLYIEKLEKQQECQTSNAIQSDLQQELTECKQRLDGVQHDKEQQQKLIETLKADLQKVKSSRKQVNVLNLEIEAAEKSLSETSVKLTAKIEELQALKETLVTKENTIVQLRKEISILESAKQSECTHAMQLKEQSDRLQMQLKDVMHSKMQTLAENKQLEQSVEGLKLELEEARMYLAKGASQQENMLSALKMECGELQQKLLESEEVQRQTQRSLSTTERSLEDLRIEYLDYKVKAQAVLRKNQQKDTSKERELEEELVALRASEAQLQSSVSTQRKYLEECDKELDILREDVAILRRRNNELLQVIEELRQQNEHLAHEGQTQLKLQQEALQNHRQQMANINTSYQSQIVQLEAKHNSQIEKLQIELAKAVRSPPTVGAVSVHNSTKQVGSMSEQSKIDFLLMEREDAEGSEAEAALQNASINNKILNASRRRSQHDFMPLEELLNAPMHAINDAVVTAIDKNGNNSNNSDGSNIENAVIELQTTKERLQMQESRLRHLTTLLAENEQDLAKLTQMNDMLKEELRRQERSEERIVHMHNSEYLKNVIIKFLTLNSADERARLVPVLNTLLKLNRAETDLLQCAAKGQRAASDGQRSSWSNFLPSWGGGGGALNNNNNSN